MKRRWLSVLIALAVALALLPTLASASPPDPSWIPGFYDDDDYDDVVALIDASASAVEPCPLDATCFGALVVARLDQTDETFAQGETSSVIHARAPPAL